MRSIWVRYGIFSLFLLSFTMPGFAANLNSFKANGFYFGLGGGWNSIDEKFSSSLVTTQDKSGLDHYQSSNNRFAPMLQIGYAKPFYYNWLWGLNLQWQYFGYATENVSTSRGQILPNATFSSINIFGPQVVRDFTSLTHLRNAFNLIAYLGLSTDSGYAYIGLGPALLKAQNNIYVSSVHTPNGVGDHLVSTSASAHKSIFGGIVTIGYNYYLQSDYFIGISYSYLQTARTKFNNTENTAILNGFTTPGPVSLNLHRTIQFNVQNVMLSINKVFC